MNTLEFLHIIFSIQNLDLFLKFYVITFGALNFTRKNVVEHSNRPSPVYIGLDRNPHPKNGIIGDILANGVIISNCNNICVIPRSKLHWTSY